MSSISFGFRSSVSGKTAIPTILMGNAYMLWSAILKTHLRWPIESLGADTCHPTPYRIPCYWYWSQVSHRHSCRWRHSCLPCSYPTTMSNYQRRQPQNTIIYKLVNEHYPRFAAEHPNFPPYVYKAFEAFLECGDLTKGFMRTKCSQCSEKTCFWRYYLGTELGQFTPTYTSLPCPSHGIFMGGHRPQKPCT